MAKKAPTPKLSDAEQVSAFMSALEHPHKAALEELRKIIKGSDKRLNERIKWNAPSYYVVEDIVTFGPMKKNEILLVFHHPKVVKVKSDLLQGDYKDRRLVYFDDLKAVKAAKAELQRILSEIIDTINP